MSDLIYISNLGHLHTFEPWIKQVKWGRGKDTAELKCISPENSEDHCKNHPCKNDGTELQCYTYVLSHENEVIKPKFNVSCPEDFVCYREGKYWNMCFLSLHHCIVQSYNSFMEFPSMC